MEIIVKPEALPIWKQCRSTLSAQRKATVRADHLMDLANSNTPPAWALGLAPWPPYLIPLQETVVKLIHKNAIEILKVTAESLRTLSKSKGQTGEAYLQTVQRIYAKHSHGYQESKNLLQTLLIRDKKTEIEKLELRAKLIKQKPYTTQEIANRKISNRVTTPDTQRASTSAANYTAPIDNPTSTTATSTGTRESQGFRSQRRGRGNSTRPQAANTRGAYRNVVTQRKQARISSRSRSPRRTQSRGPQQAKPSLNLTREEQDLIKALRQQRISNQ